MNTSPIKRKLGTVLWLFNYSLHTIKVTTLFLLSGSGPILKRDLLGIN